MSNDYVQHDSPAWRDRADFILQALIQSGDGVRRIEQLWSRQVDDYRFEVCCIPFFLYGINLGDIVETGSSGPEEYVLQRVVSDAGHYTFRVWFGASRLTGVRDNVVNEMRRLLCMVEWHSENLLAIDAPTLSVAEAVAAFLVAGHDRGDWIYETGR